jgi:2,4-dienoyl-CoA reductase-like NADH-dependent reductase (Old Yellow Enzyme family)
MSDELTEAVARQLWDSAPMIAEMFPFDGIGEDVRDAQLDAARKVIAAVRAHDSAQGLRLVKGGAAPSNRRFSRQAMRSLMAVVRAVRSYLPPGGISKDALIDRVISAVDNPSINPVIEAYEDTLTKSLQGRNQ